MSLCRSDVSVVCVLLPSLHLSEVHRCYSVRHGFFIQVAAVPSDEGGHVVTWGGERGRCS